MPAALLTLLLAGAAGILIPPWPLSPDGEPVGVRGGAALTAEPGTAEAIAPGLWRVTPAPGAAEVVLRAGDAVRRAPVEPPPVELRIAASPVRPVKGTDRAVALELALPEGAAEGPPPVVVASTGRVVDLAPAGPGRFRATYELPEARHPEIAILIALVPRCPTCATPRAVGYAVLPISAAIDLPGRADPGVRTTLTVGGRTFGPAVADAGGRFTIPIVVPPGARLAAAVAVDRLGNTRRSTLDLQLPEVDRVACAAWPTAVPADGRAAASLHCVAAEVNGTPVEEARLSAAARLGAAGTFQRLRGALQRASYRAPSGGAPAVDEVTVSEGRGGPGAGRAVRLALVTGAPADVAVVLGEPVALGATVPAEVVARDARGDRLGTAAAPAPAAQGFVAPGRFVARAGPGPWIQAAPVAFALAPGEEVATLALRREGASWLAEARTVDARPVAGARIRFGSGAEAVTDARGEARAPAGAAEVETAVAGAGARAAGFEGIAPPAAPVSLERVIEVALRPPAAAVVSARVEAGVVRWRVEDEGGRALPGRRVLLRAAGAEVGPVEPDGEGGRAVVRRGGGTVAIVDAESGAAAVVVLP